MRRPKQILYIDMPSGRIREIDAEPENDMAQELFRTIQSATSRGGYHLEAQVFLNLSVWHGGYLGTFTFRQDEKSTPIAIIGGTRDSDSELWDMLRGIKFTQTGTVLMLPPQPPYAFFWLDESNQDATDYASHAEDLSNRLAPVLLSPKYSPLDFEAALVLDESAIPPMKYLAIMEHEHPDVWETVKMIKKPLDINESLRSLLGAEPVVERFLPNTKLKERLMRVLELTWGSYMIIMDYWRRTKRVYRFAPEILSALVCQPLQSGIKITSLCILQETAIYVETPGMQIGKRSLAGFLAHYDVDQSASKAELQFLLFWEGVKYPRSLALPWGDGTTLGAVSEMEKYKVNLTGEERTVDKQTQNAVSRILQLLLYVVRETPNQFMAIDPRILRQMVPEFSADPHYINIKMS